jgi:hypothetical protein
MTASSPCENRPNVKTPQIPGAWGGVRTLNPVQSGSGLGKQDLCNRKNPCDADFNLLFEMDFLPHTSPDLLPGAFSESWQQGRRRRRENHMMKGDRKWLTLP